MPILLPQLLDLERIRAKRASRRLQQFVQQAWPIIEPGTPYIDNWHIGAICEHLEAVTLGQITRLLINVPPRNMKSTIVSVMWPVWEWIKLAHLKWMFASYSGDLSRTHSVLRRDIILSDWYQRHYGDRYRLTTDQNLKTEYKNDRHGVMFATSFGGTTTGKGGERIVFDDPHNPQQAESDQVIDSQVRFFDTSLYTRLNNKKTGAIVGVMQRLRDKDLSGHLLTDNEEDAYVHLCLPAEAEHRTVIVMPISGREIVRETGDLLWPDREGPKELAAAKRRLGPYGYAGQYQQRPVPKGGGKFKREWFRYYRQDESLEYYILISGEGREKHVRVDECDRFAVIDPAGTDKEQNEKACYTVIQVWDITPDDGMVLVHEWREQRETPDVEDEAVSICRRYQVNFLGVEIDGIGLGVIQHIGRRFGSVMGIKARGSKEARCEIAQIRMATGRIFFPAKAKYLFDLETEVESFPRSEFKDQVDAMAHAAIHVQNARGPVLSDKDEEHDKHQDQVDARREADDADDLRREISNLDDPQDWEDFE